MDHHHGTTNWDKFYQRPFSSPKGLQTSGLATIIVPVDSVPFFQYVLHPNRRDSTGFAMHVMRSRDCGPQKVYE